MFRDRNFNMSFVFSLAWHLFFISAVCIVVTPTVKLRSNYIDVNFLGPILEKTAFEIMAEDASFRKETAYAVPAVFREEIAIDVHGPVKSEKNDIFTDEFSDKGQIFKKVSALTKTATSDLLMKGKKVFYHIDEKVINKFMEGPAKNRTVLFKPPLPRVDKALYNNEIYFTAKLKFYLSNGGNVQMVEPVISTGYPRLDMECVKYLKEWKFSPGLKEQQVSDWGIITFNIKTE